MMDGDIQQLHEAKWPVEARRKYKETHPENFANSGGDDDLSFPIKDAEDVRHAVGLHGHAPDKEATKSKIISIAKRLGFAHALPDEWQEDADHVSEQQRIVIDDVQITEQLEDGLAGHAVRVTVIQGGKSKNGYAYDEAALRSVARMIEGAQAYADHARNQADNTTRSVRDVVGFYHDAQYIPGEPGRVDATLHIFEAAEWLWSVIREACLLGRHDLIGLSIDIFGQWQLNEATRAKDVTQVVSLNSCDIVTKPSAGGAFRRILHAQTSQNSLHISQHSPETSQGGTMKKSTVSEAPPAEPSTQETTVTPSQQITEQQTSPQGNPVVTVSAEQITEQQRLFEQQRTEMDQMLTQLRLQQSELQLERRLQESVLPAAVKSQIRSRFKNRIFEESELDGELAAATEMMAQLSQDGLIRGNGYEKPSVGSMISEAEKIQAAFDKMFDLEIDTAKLGNVRGFSGIYEAYVRVTGDNALSGGIAAGSTLGMIRVSESAPIARVSEADTTTASFSYLLGTSMNKRLLKDYQAWPAEWHKFCSIAPIRDFKQQVRVRFGAFGSLPVVPEDTAYTAVTLTDSAAVYVPQKRGNLVTVSREVIMNDDLQAVKQIPTKLAVAAAYTLAEFVYGFLSTNPNIYDGNALFTSGAPHSNLGSAALSTASMQTGVTAMREQTNYAGKRIGLRPKFLIVPPELEWTAMVVTKSAGIPGSTNNDINPMLGYVLPIVAPQLSNTTQWFFAADPREVDTIEVGFVGGQVNPALFIQDQPLFGLNFTQDVISYKIRHEYGGAVVDYRGLYRGI